MDRERAGVVDGTIRQRWAAFHRYGPFALLVFSIPLVLATSDIAGMGRDRVQWYLAAGLVASALLLESTWGRRALRRPGPSATGAGYYTVRWALAFALTWLNPFFVFYAVIGYFSADRLLPRPFVRAGLFATAIVMAGSESGGFPLKGSVTWAVFGALLAVNMGLVSVMMHINVKEEERNRLQDETIAELERTNKALQDAMDENAQLHT